MTGLAEPMIDYVDDAHALEQRVFRAPDDRRRRPADRTRQPRKTRAVNDISPGRAFPQGATWDGVGTNFSLWSERAERVELCLFDEDGGERRLDVQDRSAFQWHIYLRGVGPGQRYGYRVHGPYEPEAGLRFNPAKLLIDPYAKAIDGAIDWRAANTLPYQPGHGEDADLQLDDSDDAAAIPRGVVIDPRFDWGDDRPLGRSWSSTVIYETHVKGFTMRHPDIPERLRGTYAGLGSAPAIEYLQSLGITAVELLPVHQIADESFLIDKGLSNYWGYSSIGYLAPHGAYSSAGTRGEQVREFKAMVKALHSAGIEVILDVVFNHTAEGNHLGPMLSFKGIDNAGYYRLMPEAPRYYMDFTGTGNTLNTVNPAVLRLIMDSLRYFVLECHVDGFRFDLAAALARELYDVNRLSSFFDVIHQDPFLSQVKLIAEPWDVGPGGYQVGNFPILWTEWNAEYRDGIRDFWRGEAAVAELAQRLAGSAACTRATVAGRSHRSTSSRPTTGSRSPTWSPTTISTTTPISSTTATAQTTTVRGIAARRVRPTTRRCLRCGRASSAICSRPCCSHTACRCCSAGTSSAGHRRATTTPGAKTTSCRGTTGTMPTTICWTSSAG